MAWLLKRSKSSSIEHRVDDASYKLWRGALGGLMLIALVAWPILTAVPAFVVGWVMAAGLGMMHRKSSLDAS